MAKKSKLPGFTLIETLIAISVVGVVITAAWQLTVSSVKIGHGSMKQFVALHAAEEGLEVVRNMRDSNWLRNASWRSGLADGTYEIAENTGGVGAPWILQPGLENSPRVVEITTEGNAMRVKSRVKYQDGAKQKNKVAPFGRINAELRSASLRLGLIELSAEFTNWKK